MIQENNINALFIDECNIHLWKDILKNLQQHTNVIWIAANGISHGISPMESIDDFIKFELDVNLRNCASIVKEALRRDERGSSSYKKGLVLPPKNFPNGTLPAHFNSLEGAITEMKKVTNDGVLVITDGRYEENDLKMSNNMKWKWKRYECIGGNDFKEGESPYQHLVDGNILLVPNYELVNGFEWPNIISVEGQTGKVDYHPCN